jgi:hypothetical protein
MEKAAEAAAMIKNHNFRLSIVSSYYMRIKRDKKGDV